MMTHQPRRPRNDDRYEDDRYEDDRYDDEQYDRYDDRRSRRTKKSTNPLAQIPLDWLLSLGSVGIIFEATRSTSLLGFVCTAAWIVLCGIVMVYTDKTSKIGSFDSNYRKLLKRFGKTGVLGVVFGVIALTSLFLAMAEPSYAVFFTTPARALKRVFTASGDNSPQINLMIDLALNVVRIIILFAVIQAVVKGIQARDDAEAVKAQLTTVVIVICSVMVIDVVTGLIFAP